MQTLCRFQGCQQCYNVHAHIRKDSILHKASPDRALDCRAAKAACTCKASTHCLCRSCVPCLCRSGSVDSRSFAEQRKARRASVTRFPSPFSPRVQSLLKVSRSSNSNVITGNGPPSPVSPAPRRQVSRWASSGGLDYPTQDSNASQDDSELSDLAGTESLNLKPAVSKVSILDTKSSTGSVLGVRTKQCSVGTEHQGGAEHGHSQTHSVAGPALSFKIVSSADELSGQMEATTQPVEEAAQDAGLPASLAAQAAGVPAPLSTQDHGSSVPALPRAALDTLLGTATSGLPPYRTTYDQLCGTLFSDAELLQANDGVSTAIRKLATDAGGAQRGGSEGQVLTRSGTDQVCFCACKQLGHADKGVSAPSRAACITVPRWPVKCACVCCLCMLAQLPRWHYPCKRILNTSYLKS